MPDYTNEQRLLLCCSTRSPIQSSSPPPLLLLLFLVPIPFLPFLPACSTYASSLLSSSTAPFFPPPFSAFEAVGASGTLLTICSRKSSCSSPCTACLRCEAVTRRDDLSRATEDAFRVSEMMKSSSAFAVPPICISLRFSPSLSHSLSTSFTKNEAAKDERTG